MVIFLKSVVFVGWVCELFCERHFILGSLKFIEKEMKEVEISFLPDTGSDGKRNKESQFFICCGANRSEKQYMTGSIGLCSEL